VVLDPTPNPKLEELKEKFIAEGGEVYIGPDAWRHFDSLAGKTMSRFLEFYVHAPIQDLLKQVPPEAETLPEMRLKMQGGEFSAVLVGETLTVKRRPTEEEASDPDELPDDVEDVFPGP
jgi:hypothetical protein